MLANYRKELEAKNDAQLTKEIYEEMGIEVNDVDEERDEYITELVDINKMAWSSRM